MPEEIKEEEKKEEIKVEEVKEPPKAAPAPLPVQREESPVEMLLRQQESLRLENEELKKQLEELGKAKAAIDAEKRLDQAMAEGWLTPAMLKEDDEKESVFVTLARDNPEIFDRFKLVMAPKVISKAIVTESVEKGTGPLTDAERFERINQIAKEKNISYMEANRIYGGNK